MKKNIALIFVTLMIVLSGALAGCGSTVTVTTIVTSTATNTSGVSQADYNSLKTQLTQVQTDLQKAQAGSTNLQKQLADLKAQYEFTGLTAAQIAEKVIQNYHATHVYSKTDMFICGDMSSEVWNELKALNIPCVIVVGSIDTAITDILSSDHAWVLADVGGGQKLALETTAGVVMAQSDHPLYYRGWSFSSPTDLKNNNDWIKEHNLRVEFRNKINDEVKRIAALHDASTNQSDADKYQAVYNEMVLLRIDQETLISRLKSQIAGLAARF